MSLSTNGIQSNVTAQPPIPMPELARAKAAVNQRIEEIRQAMNADIEAYIARIDALEERQDAGEQNRGCFTRSWCVIL
ncbi:MAG TPA: hypothetical protein VIJ46_07425 [Rhabdochlamydiaceae bacterium]